MSELVDWPDEGDAAPPRSPRFGDTYFSAEDGLEESRTVFLAGCGLPLAWAGRRHFTIGELGFGTGLNILAVLELWARSRPPPEGRLHLFSVEAYPMAREDAERALARFPALADLAAPLLAGWPDGRRGWRRITWPSLGATLDLAVAEVGEALTDWTGRADAWLLDGFAPARNPEMWRDAVLALVAARSAPGARAASFTVAGAVRRGLQAHGFAVERLPGHGRKKQRLEARLAGAAVDARPRRIAVVGAGIAGAALARALSWLGADAMVFDAQGAGAGASGNPAALVTPRLDAGFGAAAELHAQAFARAAELYRSETPDAVIASGALQLESGPRDSDRFDRIAAWDGFADGALARLDRAEAAALIAESEAPGALAYRDGLVIEPAKVFRRWLPSVRRGRVVRLEAGDRGWLLQDAEGGAIGEAEDVVIAMGHAAGVLADGLRLQAVRGQASVADLPFAGAPAAWGGYAIPTRRGVLFGATHDRNVTDERVRAEDHARNLVSLAEGRPAMAAALADRRLSGRAGLRAAAPDHLPLAGPVAVRNSSRPGLFVLSGLGGRGFTLAPLLAEALAADLLGLGGPLPRRLWLMLRPDRFAQP
jgi:tRNA 5-methylaminomethyl-2-thiouridine biosynthesis bifunctional protein